MNANAYYNVDVSSDSTFATGVKSKLFQNRPADHDFLTGTSHIARGITATGDTLWITIDPPFGGGDSTLQAHKRAPASEIGDRDSSKDITTFWGNHYPGGSWTDGTHIFVADASQLRLYAYNRWNGNQAPSRELKLAPEHKHPRGVWANDDTFWVVNQQTQVLAYKRTPPSQFGKRDSAKDMIVQPVPSESLNGIWSDGDTLWVVDGRDKKAYAFNLALGTAWPSLDITLSREHTWATHWYGAMGIHGEGDYLWVTDNNAIRSSVFVYYQPKPGPTVSGLTLVSATSSTVTIRASTIYSTDNTTLYLRYKTPFASAWSVNFSATGGKNVDFSLTGVSSMSQLFVQVSRDSTFADATEATDTITLRPTQQDFDITQPTGELRGLWASEHYIWSLQRTENRGLNDVSYYNRAYSYSMTDKTLQASRQFTVSSTISPQGISGRGEYLLMMDANNNMWIYDRILEHRPTERGKPRRLFARHLRTVEIDTGDGEPRGMWLNGDILYTVGHNREHIYAYNIAGNRTTGVRETAKEGPLATSYAEPRGMWRDGTTLWVADAHHDRIFAYEMSASGVGDRKFLMEIKLDRDNWDPWGITSRDGVLWVADATKRKVFAYNLPTAPSGPITNVEISDLAVHSTSVTVTISNPGSASKTVGIKYMILPNGPVQQASDTITGRSTSFDLTGLSAGTFYSLLVSVDAKDEIVTPGFRTLTESEQRSHFLKNTVVADYVGSYPWVGDVYDSMRRWGVEVRATNAQFSQVILDCGLRLLEHLNGCGVERIEMAAGHATNAGVYLHEMGHVYNAGAYVGDDSLGGRGIAWLYFEELSRNGTSCRIHELYADAAAIATKPDHSGNWFPACSNTGTSPSAATLSMIRSVLANEIPTWFDDNYQFGAGEVAPYSTSAIEGYSHDYDLESLWSDVKEVPSWDFAAIFALRNAFGGYCKNLRATTSHKLGGPPRNPWRAGGCVAHAPAVSVDAATRTISWEAPLYDGGENIFAYVVQWAGQDGTYDPENSDDVDDETFAYVVSSDLLPGTSVKVTAYNMNGQGVSGEASIPVVAPYAPDAPSLSAGDTQLVVSWTAPASDGGAPVTSYDLRYIRSDVINPSDSDWIDLFGVSRSATLAYTITGLTNSVSYYVQVRAINRIGAGDWSGKSSDAPLSSDNNLSALTLSEARLNPSFSSSTTDYTVAVGHTVIQTTVTATINDASASLTFVRPSDADSTTDGHQAALSVGETEVVIEVTSALGGVKTYTVTVTRTEADTALTPATSDPSTSFSAEAVYTVTFRGEWTTDVTPDGVPSGAQFSRLVGATHGDAAAFLSSGSNASAGIEAVSEDGSNATFKSEVQSAITAMTALAVLQGSSSSINRTSSSTLQATLTTAHPQITLVTRIAQSPDWFVGVSVLLLIDSNALWLRSHTVDLYPWDAGTEEGDDFSSTDTETVPPDAISSIRGTGQFSIERIARLSFELQSISTTRAIAENSSAGTNIGEPVATVVNSGAATYSLSGTDRRSFEIESSDGQLKTRAALNYEDKSRYTVVVTASDTMGSADTTVTINVTNVDETGNLSLFPQNIRVGSALTATLTDPDDVGTTAWTWERSMSGTGSWQTISGATSLTYTPVANDIDHYLRVSANYSDSFGSKSLSAISDNQVLAPPPNFPPEFSSATATREVAENSGAPTPVGAAVTATDAENEQLTYSLSGADAASFAIGSTSGQISVGQNAQLNYETKSSYTVTVTATDTANNTGAIVVTINLTDVNERPEPENDTATTNEDIALTIDVLSNDHDPENDSLQVTLRNRPKYGSATVLPNQRVLYTPNANFHEDDDEFSYRATDGDGLSADATVSVTIISVNDDPVFPSASLTRTVSEQAEPGDNVGTPVRATDVDGDTIAYTLGGADAGAFEIRDGGQIVVAPSTTFDVEIRASYTVLVEANDGNGGSDQVDVTINVTSRPVSPPSGGGAGGGGGAPAVVLPSDVDFDWNVTRDIEDLARDNGTPTGIWSTGSTVWVLENSLSGADALFVYSLVNGERQEGREIQLDSRNRFSHGIWSNSEIVWIADSGQDRLFAYELESGERQPEQEWELAERNRDPRGIWSDDEVMYVLDSVKDALFVYDLQTGELRAEHPLDKLNQSPRGIWSDGVTLWVSDDGAKRLFAYELEDEVLTRNEDLEFTFRSLVKAGNGDPRGIWSDGEIMYVVDEQDDKVYTYNIPDAIIAQLASLSLSGIEIGEFSTDRRDYTATAKQDASVTTVEAATTQDVAHVVIEPVDADGDPENGHQISLGAETTITITVTSTDGSRTRSYRVLVNKPGCLHGLSEERLSAVNFVGGQISDLETCARSLEVSALYHSRAGVWTALFLFPEAPEFLSQPFRDRFARGISPQESLIAHRQLAAAASTAGTTSGS